MKFVFVTQDVGPGNAHRIIGGKLKAQGHDVVLCLGGGKPFSEEMASTMSDALMSADKLIVSVSSAENRVAEERCAFKEARRRRVPIAVFSDIYGMYHRPWFSDLLNGANVLFVVDEKEVPAARRYVDQGTKIVPAANPCWAEYFTVKHSSEEVRARLGVKREEKLILVAGTKELERNVLLYHDIVMATRGIDFPLHLVLTMHPGANHTKDVYDGILKWSKHPVQFPAKEVGLSSQDIIAGSDLVVSCGGSTVSIMGACQRKPVIDLMHGLDRLWWEELSGLPFWPPAQQGASALGGDVYLLKSNVEDMLSDRPPPDSHLLGRMRAAQEKLFSLSQFEGAVETIVRELTD